MPEKPIMTVFTPVPKFHYRVGIYCRVSTKSQEQLDSLANQVSYLTRLVAAKLDWSLADIYLDIRSGANVARRNEFQRLLADCRDHKLDVVFTKSISRFGRNTVETLAAINELRACRVEVVFDQDDISTKDPSSQIMISILEGVAQAESEAKGKNIRWGILRKVENGTSSLFTRKCYGYCIDGEGNLQIDDAEASVVRLVYDLYQHGKSVLSILRELENRGVKSPTGKEKWCKRSIDVMLSNEKYSGDVVVFKTFTAGFPNRRRTSNEGQRERYISVSDHPAIISKEVFAAVQAEKAQRSNIDKTDGGKIRKKTRFSSKQEVE